jgi:hypothetical protein
MPQSIPKGLTRECVLQALADLDAGIEHPFGQPTGYELVHEGKRYPPKAVIGLACRSLLGRMLLPEEFSGGEVPGQANFVLRELGFMVVHKDAASGLDESEAAQERGQPWTHHEVDLIVADYFEMLRAELSGENYSKSAHNQALRPRLNHRSKSSVEYKHQNISAVLIGLGLPYIDGYKPARNYQKTLLPQAVGEYLIRHPEFFETLVSGPVLSPTQVPRIGDRPVEDYFESRPERIIVPEADEKPWLSRRSRRIDFARRDAYNRHLGELGEQFAVELEKQRLRSADRDDLAAKVEWVARTCGDGVGFDVLSFDTTDESEWWIEVKTTGLGKHFPFYVTANEVRCSEDRPGQFRLYRVYDFGRNPRVYMLAGALSRECRLEPVEYRVSM